VPKNRIKIDINDVEGNKITIALEGHLTRDKMLQLLDFVELLESSSTIEKNPKISNLSKFDKIKKVILRKFPLGWFTSQEVMIAYEDALDEPIGLSTVSTYLTRLTTKGILKRTGSVAKRKYRLFNLTDKKNRSQYKVST